MTQLKFNCHFCRATIRYLPNHVGREIKCPKCKHDITVPGAREELDENEIVLGGPIDEERLPKLADPGGTFCQNCGQRVNPGVTKCRRCRDEDAARLAARMKTESAIDRMMGAQLQQEERRRGTGIPMPLYILLLVLTLGTWIPIIYFLNRNDDDRKSSSSSEGSGRKSTRSRFG